MVHAYAVVLSSALRDSEALRYRAESLNHLGDRNPAFVSISDLALGLALNIEGKFKEGIVWIRRAASCHQEAGFRLLRAEELAAEAEFYAHEGRINEALSVSQDAVQETEELSVYRPRVLTQRANLLSQAGENATYVEATYREAVLCASNQGNKFEELKGTTSFARWLRTRHRLSEARAMLANIYNWFTEGFDTLALREASVVSRK
jgi:hypothetical protein